MTQSYIRTDLGGEFRSLPAAQLLPVERKFIGWSLTIGLVLLVALGAINHFFR